MTEFRHPNAVSAFQAGSVVCEAVPDDGGGHDARTPGSQEGLRTDHLRPGTSHWPASLPVISAGKRICIARTVLSIERFGGVKQKPRPADINGPAFNPVGRAAGAITHRRLDRESLSPRLQSFALRLAVSRMPAAARIEITVFAGWRCFREILITERTLSLGHRPMQWHSSRVAV